MVSKLVVRSYERFLQRKICDDNEHRITKGSKYLKCKYYEKYSETKGFVTYKLSNSEIYVLSYQVVCHYIAMDKLGRVSTSEYQFLCDCIWVKVTILVPSRP